MLTVTYVFQWKSPGINMRRDHIFEQKIKVVFHHGARDGMTPGAHVPVDIDTSTIGKRLGLAHALGLNGDRDAAPKMGILFQPEHTICFQSTSPTESIIRVL